MEAEVKLAELFHSCFNEHKAPVSDAEETCVRLFSASLIARALSFWMLSPSTMSADKGHVSAQLAGRGGDWDRNFCRQDCVPFMKCSRNASLSLLVQ